MIKFGILHRLILIFAIFLNSYFYLVYKHKEDLEFSDLIMFALIVIFLVLFVLIPELKKLFKSQKIARIKRFDFRNLIFLIIIIPALLLADWETLNSGLSNLDSNFYIAFLWFTIIFLRRDNYYVITKKWIRFWGFDGFMNSTRINFKDIVEIEDNENIITIKTDRKTLEIDMTKILKVDEEGFNNELNSLKNTVHNKVYN
jgi:hypothetical protein